MTNKGASELASLEANVDLLRIAQARDVALARAELLATDALDERIALLADWGIAFPRAMSQLLRVIADNSDDSLQLVPAVLGCRTLGADDVDDVLAAAFSRLTGALRDAAADRAGVRARLRIPEGVGYTPVPPPQASWLWPRGCAFPKPNTVAGVQARLNYLDLGAGPVDGEWTEQTRNAFTRWQVLNGLPPTGETDEESIDYLAFKTPEAPD